MTSDLRVWFGLPSRNQITRVDLREWLTGVPRTTVDGIHEPCR